MVAETGVSCRRPAPERAPPEAASAAVATGSGRSVKPPLQCGAGKVGEPDISSGTISTIIAATALLGLGIVALEIIRRREPRERDDRLVQAVDDMRTRMDDLGRDLSEALERAERE